MAPATGSFAATAPRGFLDAPVAPAATSPVLAATTGGFLVNDAPAPSAVTAPVDATPFLPGGFLAGLLTQPVVIDHEPAPADPATPLAGSFLWEGDAVTAPDGGTDPRSGSTPRGPVAVHGGFLGGRAR